MEKSTDANIYDLLIVGGGPAGLAAAIYAARAKMNMLLLEKDVPGGQAARTKKLNNYPGAKVDSSGPQLMEDWLNQAMGFGVKIKRDEVIDVQLEGEIKSVTTKKNKVYNAYAIIICCGILPQKLEIPGKKELMGKGVSYCATCDAPFLQDKEVFIFGAGDNALEDAIVLTRFAKHVNIVIPFEANAMSNAAHFEQAQADHKDKINLFWNHQITEIKGTEKVSSLVLQNNETGETSEHSAEGVFFFTGMAPQTDIFRGKIDLTSDGYIITDEMMQTSLPGIFAAGDIREKFLRQVVTSASDGAIAATAAGQYVEALKKGKD
ncbi:MAG: NAD(P)/FAD-dependent oxidoreductase [Bacillota bacterium]